MVATNHAVFLDGVFAQRSGRMVFHSVRLEEAAGTESEGDDGLATCYAASVQGRIAFGPAAGWQIPRIVDPDKATALYRPGKLCAQHGGALAISRPTPRSRDPACCALP